MSAKTGVGVHELLEQIVREIPAPVGRADAPARAMIFDSVYDTYRGVITYIRVVDGTSRPRERIQMMSTGAIHELLEVGRDLPQTRFPGRGSGSARWATSSPGSRTCASRASATRSPPSARAPPRPWRGYRDPKPMVFSGLYPIDGSDYPELRDALDKLKLNDAALVYEPETSLALGFGFRCGFLGLLHMEIVRERLEREYDLDLISTAPNVVYRVVNDEGNEIVVTNPSEFPTQQGRQDPRAGGALDDHPARASSSAPSWSCASSVAGHCSAWTTCPRTASRCAYTLPLAEIVFDFFDALKSKTRGYASLDYELTGEQESDLVKVDILLHGEPVDAFSAIVHRDKAMAYGVMMTAKLKELIPRQQFEVPIQAAIGVTGHRARDHPRDPQGRPRQVLRRRHHPQAQAPREAEGGQEAHEDGRPRRGAPGGLHRRALDLRRAEEVRGRTLRANPCWWVADEAHEGRTPAGGVADEAHEGRTPGGGRLGIYLHVPFCTSRCGYCDFNTYTATELGDSVRRDDFHEVLAAEVRLAAATLGDDCRPVSTVFVGGGTPTTLGSGGLTALLQAVRDEFGLEQGAEVTTEANPDSVDGRMLDDLLAGGFTRISFGMQSSAPAVLRVLDRTHTPGASVVAARAAARAGFGHVNLDLIYGTPGETDDDLRRSVEDALAAGVDHVSAYALIVEAGTPLARRVRRGELPMPDDDVAAERYAIVDELLSAAGLPWYEVSNWARPGGQCRHNLGYWHDRDWWGIGPGAHSHVGGSRWWNVKHPRTYADRLAAGSSPEESREVLTDDQRRMERVMLGIRLAEGLPIDAVHPGAGDRIALLAVRGLLCEDALARGRLVLTDRGRLLADAVIRDVTG